MSNIIGIIVYISANSGDPSQSDNKKSYSYGWSFYFGALSFVLAEMVGVLAVHVFIEKHRQLRTNGRPSLLKLPVSRGSSNYRNRYHNNCPRRHSSRSNHSGAADSAPDSLRASLAREASFSSGAKVAALPGLPSPVVSELMLYALKDADVMLDSLPAAPQDADDLLAGNCAANRRTTPV